MASIFEGLETIVDNSLQLDESWAGQAPRYKSKSTLLRLVAACKTDFDGIRLIRSLYDRLQRNWDASDRTNGLPSGENWRFEKRVEYSDDYQRPEPLLERTIASVVDNHNWANQVPVDSGLLGGRAHWMDLVFRAGTEFFFIELKYEANTPLSAAVQVIQYGLIYAFMRSHASDLKIDLDRSPILGATAIHLRVLAPADFYSGYGQKLDWLAGFEKSIHSGVKRLASESSGKIPSMSFQFETFPGDFNWDPQTAQKAGTRKDVLWAIHHREPVF